MENRNPEDAVSHTQSLSVHMRAGDSYVVDFFTNTIPLFSVLNSFESNQPHLFVLLGFAIYFAQHVGFIINAHFKDVLGNILGNDIINIFYGFHVPFYDPLFVYTAQPSSLVGMVFASIALGLILYGVMLFYHTTSANSDKQNPAFVYFNRMLIHAMTTILLIPMLQICFAGMVCGEFGTIWHYAAVSPSSTKCWGTEHLVTFIPSALFIMAVLPLLYLSLGCQHESRPNNEHLKSRRHSLVDEIGFAHDVVSCLLFQVLIGYEMRGAFAIIHAASSLFVAASYAYYLPFYELGVNQFYCASHATEALVSAIVAAGLLNPTFAVSGASSVLIISLLPFAIVYGAIMATYRINPEFLHNLQLCRTEKGGHSDQKTVLYPTGLSDDQAFPPFPELESTALECITRQEAHDYTTGANGDTSSTRSDSHRMKEVLCAFITHIYTGADVDLAASFIAVFEEQLSEPPTINMLMFATKMYHRGLVTFPLDPLVMYRFAAFTAYYIPAMSFVGLELIESMTANSNTSFILRYRAHHTAAALRMALGIRNQAHLLHSNRARNMHGKVLSHMHNFWLKLTEPSVNIGQVSDIAEEINTSRMKALAQFRRALQHQTSSDAMLVHRLGDFLRDVMMDVEGANECYNEAKEIHEARQARSMRGTKQHTTVELDVETLTERLVHLLEGKRESNSSTGHSSSVVQYLLMNVTIIFCGLLAIAALFLYVAVSQQQQNLSSVDRIASVSVLRLSTPSFVADVLEIASAENASRTPHMLSQMTQEASRYATNFSAISSGQYRSNAPDQVQFLTDVMVPAYVDSLEASSGYALWTLSESFLASMHALLQTANTSTASLLSDRHAQYLISAVDVLGTAFDHLMTLTEGEVASHSTTALSWCITLFVVGAVVVVLTYVAFLISFRRTALGRVFTFQLFTLIPFDDLEKLASDTKDKMQTILDEKKAQAEAEHEAHATTPENGAVAAEDLTANDDANSEGRRRSSSSQRGAQRTAGSSSLFSDVAHDPNLKSCVRRPASPRTGKKVTFSSVVETFGGKEDENQSLTVGRKGDAGLKRMDEKVDEDEPLLLERRQTSDKAKKKEGEYSATEKAVYMGSYGLMIVLICASLVLFGLSMQSVNSAKSNFNSYQSGRVDMWRSTIWTTLALPSYFSQCVYSGSKIDFNTYQEAAIKISMDVSATVGLSKDEITSIVGFKKALSALEDIYNDCIALAAKYHNVDLSAVSSLRTRTSLSQTALFGVLQQKYPSAIKRVTNRFTALGATPNMLDFVWSIVADQDVSALLDEMQSHGRLVHSMLYQDLRDSMQVALQPSALAAAIALIAVAAFICVLLMVPDVEVLTSDTVGRVHFFAVFVAICVPLGLAVGAWSQGACALTTIDNNYNVSMWMEQGYTDMSNSMMHAQVYAGVGETSFFFSVRHTDFIDQMRRLPQVLKDANLVTAATSSIITNLYGAMVVVQRLIDISNVLAIVGFSAYVAPEPEMLTLKNDVTWLYKKEDEYRFTEQMFPTRTFRYSSMAVDLALPAMTQVRLAGATLGDIRADYYNGLVQNYYRYFVGNVSKILAASVGDSTASTTSLTSAALVCCALPLLVILLLTLRLGYLFTQVMGLQANTSTNSMDTSMYTALINRCQYALMSLICMLAITFGIGIWATQTAATPTHQLNLATKRDYLIVQSLLDVRTLMSNSSRPMTQSVISSLIGSIRDVGRDLYFGPTTSSSFYIAGKFDDFDGLTFGPATPTVNDAILLSYYTDVCGSLLYDAKLDFASRGPFAGYANPTQQGIFYWRILLNRIVDAAGNVDVTALDLSIISSVHAILTELRDPLLNALAAGSEMLHQHARTEVSQSGGAFIGVAAATIAAVIVVYLFVVLPTVQRLVDEDESAKLLLRMIPLHVRDQVPAISEFIETGKIDNAAELQRKFEASEKLLQNILPQKIAARLKSGEQPIADTHPCLTILFTDFVGFTKRSSAMRADEIVDFLNEVFLEFDTIVELLELEKIKTIGDAYFMAGGLDPRISDHAMRVIEAGMLFFQALEEHNARHPDRALLQMRLGVHTGPAVAGVIGTKKVAYDLWGESVEIANAMESTGVPGRVHISEDTARHVTGFYKLEPRGELPREKEHIPDCMPATFLVTGRLLPTPYQHIQRPRMLQTKISTEKN